jgi:uncharacterized protein DUF3551
MRGLILSSGLLVAALVAGPQAAVAQTAGKAFCLQGPGGAMNCTFDSLAQCEQRRSSPTAGACVPNPGATTGAGRGMRDPASPPNPPGGGQYLPGPSQSR